MGRTQQKARKESRATKKLSLNAVFGVLARREGSTCRIQCLRQLSSERLDSGAPANLQL